MKDSNRCRSSRSVSPCECRRIRGGGRPGARRAAGVTLLELVVTVAIVAILAAIAIPSYLQYIIRTNRSAAKSLLLQVADREEQFFADNKRYATDMTDLGYATNGFMIDDSGAIVGAASTERIYAIFLVGASATAFTVVASPQLRQAAKDAACGKFTLDNLGQRKATGGAPECW